MNLIQVEHNNQRVLTTQQLAEAYGTDTRRISENFTRNYERYQIGKHYILLEGEDKTVFLNNTQIADSYKNASKLYLWTEKGAWLHAKSLNTDKAWESYELLVDTYYSIKDKLPKLDNLSPQLQLLINMEIEQKRIAGMVEQAQNTATEAKQEVQAIRDVVAINPSSWRNETSNILNKIAKSRGGTSQDYIDVRDETYKLLSQRAGTKLDIKLTNRKRKVLEETGSRSKADKVTKVDVIADDKRLTEVYIAIVKEMAIKYNIGEKNKGGCTNDIKRI